MVYCVYLCCFPFKMALSFFDFMIRTCFGILLFVHSLFLFVPSFLQCFCYQVCVWPQAGRSRAIWFKNSETIIVKLFTKSVCGPRLVDLEQFPSKKSKKLCWIFLPSLCVAPSASISSNVVQIHLENDFKVFDQVCVWPQAGRSRAVSFKNIEKNCFKAF